MTVIITSDQVSSRTLGNSYGLLGPLDFSLFLDFNAGSYKKRVGDTLASFSLSEVVSVLRGTEGEYMGSDGVWMSAGPNTPRIHHMEEMGVSGLLVEGPRSNLLTNPRSPATQTVTVPVTAGLPQALALRVEGTGSATMSGGVTELSRASATQGAPQGAMPVDSGNGTAQVTVTITGSVTRFQLERCPATQGGNYASTFVPDGLATRDTEIVTLTPSMAETLGGAEGTIVAQWVEHERLVTNFAAQMGVVAAVDSGNPDGGLYLRRAISAVGVRNQSLVAIPPNSSTAAKSFNIPAPGVRRNTSVLAWGNRGQHVSNTINGNTSENSDALSLNNPDKVIVGGNDGFGSSTREAGGILTRLVIYKRELSREEIIRISTSWT